MRVTHKMMVNNVSFWLSQQAEKLSNAERVVATGKQINEPSDDPSSASRILEDRTTISTNGQYQSNMDQAITWIKASETTLDAADTLLQEAQNILLDQGSGDLETRDSALRRLRSIYDQIIGLANTRYGSGYMYSGDLTDSTPYADEVVISEGTPSELFFGMAEDASDVTIEIFNSAGDVVRAIAPAGGATEGVHTVTWDGLDDAGDPLPDGNYDFVVTASNATGDPVAAYAPYRGDAGSKRVITGPDSAIYLNTNGEEIFSDGLCTLSRLITALQAADYDMDPVNELNDSLSSAIAGLRPSA